MAKTRASISRITSPLTDYKGGRIEAEGERETAKSLVVSFYPSPSTFHLFTPRFIQANSILIG